MKRLIPMIGIVAVFLATRILALSSAGSFWFDEAFSVHFASMPLAEMWQFLQFEHNPLVHFVSLHYWIQLFGSSEIAVRSLSLVAGLLSLGMIYLLGAKLFNRQVGLWAAGLMTLSTMMVYHQTEGRMYGLVLLFSLVVVRCLWGYMASSNQVIRSSGNQWLKYVWLAGYTLAAMLLVHTHITAWALVVALWVYWFVEMRGRAVWGWVVANIIVVASFLIWFIPMILNKQVVGNNLNGWFFGQVDDGFWLSHLTNFLMIGESAMVLRSVGAFVVVLLLVMAVVHFERPGWWQQIRSVFDRSRWPVTGVLDWSREIRFLLILIGVVSLIGFALQITVTKYLITAGPLLFIFMARGIERLGKWQFKVIVAGLLILIVLPMHLRLYTQPRHNWDKAADKLEALIEQYPDAKILSHSFAWALPLQFYYEGETEITPFYPLDDDLSFDERVVRYNWQSIVNHDNIGAMSDLVEDASALILISSTPDDIDPVEEWLAKNGWRFTDRFNWSGYGDPEIEIFLRN